LLLHPVIAESGFAGLGAAVSGSTVADDFPAPTRVCADLLQRFAQVSDGRRDQGRVHPVAVVLALCAAAVVAGMASFTAIAGWATDVPAEVLVKLYGRRSDPPSKATIWRVVTGADAATVDAVIGSWLLAQAAARDTAAREVVAGEVVVPGTDRETPELLAIMVDGKAVRGATDAEGNQTHLLAAATHDDALVVGQVEVGAKSNEIPQFAPLLDTLAAAGVDLAHTVITADALHTQRAHADYLHERGAGFVFTCKQNQPRLFAALDALPWAQTPIAARQVDRGHGRVTTRTVQVMPRIADLPRLADRTLRHRPRRHPVLRGRRARRDEPDRRHHHPAAPRRPGPQPLGHRVAALATRHRLPRGQLHRPHQVRTPRHGRPAQPRSRRPPSRRPT
jgi:predicted transposase YbfD/YdcC